MASETFSLNQSSKPQLIPDGIRDSMDFKNLKGERMITHIAFQSFWLYAKGRWIMGCYKVMQVIIPTAWQLLQIWYFIFQGEMNTISGLWHAAINPANAFLSIPNYRSLQKVCSYLARKATHLHILALQLNQLHSLT